MNQQFTTGIKIVVIAANIFWIHNKYFLKTIRCVKLKSTEQFYKVCRRIQPTPWKYKLENNDDGSGIVKFASKQKEICRSAQRKNCWKMRQMLNSRPESTPACFLLPSTLPHSFEYTTLSFMKIKLSASKQNPVACHNFISENVSSGRFNRNVSIFWYGFKPRRYVNFSDLKWVNKLTLQTQSDASSEAPSGTRCWGIDEKDRYHISDLYLADPGWAEKREVWD